MSSNKKLFGGSLQIPPFGLGIGSRVGDCEIKYYIKASENEMRLLNRVMAWANEGGGRMDGRGRGVLQVYGWSGQGSLRDLRRYVTSSGEPDVGGMYMEEASGRVERQLQQITKVKVLGSFSRRYSFCRMEDERSS